MKKNLLNDAEADKYSKEIDKQMMASMMIEGSQNEENVFFQNMRRKQQN